MKVSLDSRLIQKGEYFVPVKGESFDGHQFVEAALKNGAAGVIEEEELYKIASEKLQKINPVVIAITGSVGKTTMREFISALLSTQFKVCIGNLNTKLGLAVNILNDMQEDTEFFVAECGMDKKGELLETGSFIKPKVVVLTNISESHMEKLGSLEAIKEAKAELLQTLPKNGVAFFNWSNKNVRDVAKKYAPLEWYQYGELSELDKKLYFDKTNIIGEHLWVSIDGAYKVADYFNLKNLEGALKSIKPAKGRLTKIAGINGSRLFDDTYNASPVSCQYALQAVHEYFVTVLKGRNRKIAVLGGMLELGSFEDVGHKIVGDKVAELEYDHLILVGDLAKKIVASEKLRNSKVNIHYCKDNLEAGEFVKNEIKPKKGDVILVKASQGIRLEKTVEVLMAHPETAKDLLVRQDARWK